MRFNNRETGVDHGFHGNGLRYYAYTTCCTWEAIQYKGKDPPGVIGSEEKEAKKGKDPLSCRVSGKFVGEIF